MACSGMILIREVADAPVIMGISKPAGLKSPCGEVKIVNPLFVGIDVSSKNNVAYLMKPDGSKHSSFSVQNNLGGAKILSERIVSALGSMQLSDVVIGLEATSIYGDSLVYALREDGSLGRFQRKIHVLNPKQVKKFKEAYPDLPKNDFVDAFVIADHLRFGRIAKEVYMDDYNPNMPLRGLMYFSALYRQFLSRQGTDLYSSSLVKIPSPRYVVFYNGLRELPDVSKLRLSDAFEIPNESGEFEWTATVYNVNAGRNSAIMESCVALAQYADFIQWVRENSETMPAKDAVDAAVRQAIAQNYLNGFFKKHREEVVDVSLTEFNEEEFARNRLKEGEAKLGKLMDLLLKQGLIDLARLVAVDAQEREKQYQRFGIN